MAGFLFLGAHSGLTPQSAREVMCAGFPLCHEDDSMTRKTAVALTVAIVGLALAWGGSSSRVEGQQGARPLYTPQGELKLPVGFESWVFVGSNLGMVYRPDAPPTPAMTAMTNARE